MTINYPQQWQLYVLIIHSYFLKAHLKKCFALLTLPKSLISLSYILILNEISKKAQSETLGVLAAVTVVMFVCLTATSILLASLSCVLAKFVTTETHVEDPTSELTVQPGRLLANTDNTHINNTDIDNNDINNTDIDNNDTDFYKTDMEINDHLSKPNIPDNGDNCSSNETDHLNSTAAL